MWNSSRRTGFESALVRADAALRRALEHADAADADGVTEDITLIRGELIMQLRASQAERKPRAPKPIPGQTSITG